MHRSPSALTHRRGRIRGSARGHIRHGAAARTTAALLGSVARIRATAAVPGIALRRLLTRRRARGRRSAGRLLALRVGGARGRSRGRATRSAAAALWRRARGIGIAGRRRATGCLLSMRY